MAAAIDSFMCLAPSKGIRIWRESGKFLVVECAIQEILLVEFGIQGFGIRNTTNVWNPKSKFHWPRRIGIQYLGSGIHGVESRIQDWIPSLVRCIGLNSPSNSLVYVNTCFFVSSSFESFITLKAPSTRANCRTVLSIHRFITWDPWRLKLNRGWKNSPEVERLVYGVIVRNIIRVMSW